MANNERRVGTVSRGIRCGIIREGDDLAKIVSDSVIEASEIEGFELRDRDVISITESIVARAQGNYASVDAIAKDVKAKLGGETIGVIFPILSRNRFAICLRGIAKAAKKIVLMLSYPSDEVGNHLVSLDMVDNAGVNPYSDVLTLDKYRELFGENKHEFTGVDYVQYYSDIIREEGAEVEVIFANQAKTILDYTDCVLTCDIHTRVRTKRILREAGAKAVCGLDDIMTESVNGSGCDGGGKRALYIADFFNYASPLRIRRKFRLRLLLLRFRGLFGNYFDRRGLCFGYGCRLCRCAVSQHRNLALKRLYSRNQSLDRGVEPCITHTRECYLGNTALGIKGALHIRHRIFEKRNVIRKARHCKARGDP